MKHIYAGIFMLVVLLFVSVACKKSVEPVKDIDSPQVQPGTALRIGNVCANAPDYGDSILYAQATNQNAVILPKNPPAVGAGKYCALPSGLNIDSVTGAINPSKSESGMRYMVGFVKTGSTDTCFNTLVIGGATYVDSMYVVSASQYLATPSYNANSMAVPACNAGDDNDDGQGDNKCKYASSNKLVKIRSVSGAIDLKKTLSSRAFGIIPLDGTTIYTTVNYSLSDKSNNASQQVTVKLVYYRKRSSVPAALANYVTANRDAFLQNQALRTAPRPPVIVVSSSN